MTTQHILCKGKLAYFDSFAGLVPAKVLSVYGAQGDAGFGSRVLVADLRLTANRGAYKRGEIITTRTAWAVPRAAVRVRSGQYVITGATVPVPDTCITEG